jgi:tetratricopeptide (TPR) repeat protein
MHSLAVLLAAKGDNAEAELLHRRVLETRERTLGKDHPHTLISADRLASLMEAKGDLTGAESLFRQALRASEAKLGKEHPVTLAIKSNLATLLAKKGDHDEAEALFRGTLPAQKKVLGTNHLNLAWSFSRFGNVLEKRNKLEEAENAYRESLTILRAAGGLDYPQVGGIIQLLVNLLAQQGKFTEAHRVLDELLSFAGESRPQQADLLLTRGHLAARQGRFQEAVADLTKALGARPYDHLVYLWLAPAVVASGDIDGYRRCCQGILTRFAGTNEPTVADRMAKACLIVPISGVDLEEVGKMARIAVTEGKTNSFLPYFQFVMGLAEYRQGRFASAVEWLQKALANRQWPDDQRDVQANMVLAMAQCQLKQIEDARKTLATGTDLASRKLPKADSGDLGYYWHDRILADALMLEAKTLIGNK